ncbi:MAG: hypothetical protein ACTSVC_06915 [Promethearchaeota archaeon]
MPNEKNDQELNANNTEEKKEENIAPSNSNKNKENPLLKLKERLKELTKIEKEAIIDGEGVVDKDKLIEVEITDQDVEEFRKKLDQMGGFDRIGYARPLGGYFYQFFYAILGAAIIAGTYGLILKYLYPYPTAKGYVDAAMVLFSFIQFIFNVPTGYAIERFMAEWRIKYPEKMLEYMRFYIWYQMTTGIILVSSLSVYILYMLQSGNLVYAKWLMLIQLTREYPAMLDIFLQGLKGIQRFDYESKINFIKDLISKSCEVIFVLLGRWWGMQNPKIGELMGLAIGYAFGTYIDDFINMLVAARYFRKALKHMGYKMIDVLVPKIRKDVIMTSLWFGFQTSWPGFFNTFIGMFNFFAWYNTVPAYATLVTLNKTADELANITKRSEGINLKAAISESYNNKRKHLTQFYIAQIWKWYGFFTTGIGIIVITFFPALLTIMFSGGELKTYLLAIPFVLPNVIHTLIEAPNDTAQNIILGANKPMFNSIVSILQSGANLFMTYLWIFVLQLPQKYGIAAMIWLLPMGTFIPDFLAVLARWLYINKKIVKIHIPIWQAFVAPLIPGLITFAVGRIWVLTVHVWLIAEVGNILAGIITILFAFIVCFMFIFITLYSYFGGWDDYGLKVFDEAVAISGPSRIFFKPIVVMSHVLIKISPLHNKFPIPWEKADREAIELMIIRERNDQVQKT